MTVQEFYTATGGDLEDLLKRIPREAMISRFVKKYAESEDFDRMLLAYEAEDYRGVFEASHNIKGMTANLSLTSLTVPVSEICEAVRNGAPDKDISGLIKTAKEAQDKVISLAGQLV